MCAVNVVNIINLITVLTGQLLLYDSDREREGVLCFLSLLPHFNGKWVAVTGVTEQHSRDFKIEVMSHIIRAATNVRPLLREC